VGDGVDLKMYSSSMLIRDLREYRQRLEILARDLLRRDSQVKDLQRRLETSDICKGTHDNFAIMYLFFYSSKLNFTENALPCHLPKEQSLFGLGLIFLDKLPVYIAAASCVWGLFLLFMKNYL